MATIEIYARVWARYKGRELSLGVQIYDGELHGPGLAYIQDRMEEIGMMSLVQHELDSSAVDAAKRAIVKAWPERAYFTEIDSGPDEIRRGVQIFQPYGLPQVQATELPKPAITYRYDEFGSWTGPGHAPGCEKNPRTARGCYCGGDHQ